MNSESSIESVCAWCQKERGEQPQPNQSHGICERHKQEWFDAEDARVRHQMIDDALASKDPAQASRLIDTAFCSGLQHTQPPTKPT